MKKELFFILFMFITGLVFCQQVNSTDFEGETQDTLSTSPSLETELPQSVDYYYELIKFYISEQEFDLALTYLDSLSSNMTDSLYYFQGLSQVGKENWQNAVKSFGRTIIEHRREELKRAATEQIKLSLQNLPAMTAIDLISDEINKLESSDLLADFLFILAWIYEQNQLYAEANDVYQTIIRETDYEDKIDTQLKIATNYIFLKEYENALVTLSPVLALNDSIYNQDALFFSYIANYSLNDFSAASEDLIKLYEDYPDHPQRIDILQGLAEIFEQQKQYLMSWYMLIELKAISSDMQKVLIRKKIDQLKKLIGTEDLQSNQFEYLEPVFDN